MVVFFSFEECVHLLVVIMVVPGSVMWVGGMITQSVTTADRDISIQQG